jgi:hypothetical protein
MVGEWHSLRSGMIYGKKHSLVIEFQHASLSMTIAR